MDGIATNNVVHQQSKNGNKFFKHTGNAVLTGGAMYCAAKGLKAVDQVLEKKYVLSAKGNYSGKGINGAIRKVYARINDSVSSGLYKLSEKIFPKTGKLHAIIKGLAERCGNPVSANELKYYKSNAASFLLGTIALMGILTAGVYKAGKINAEGK